MPHRETQVDTLRGSWVLGRFLLLLCSGVALLVAKATLRGDMTTPAVAAVLAAGAALAAAGLDAAYLARRNARVAAGSDRPGGLTDGGFTVTAFACFPLLMAIQPGMPSLGRWITVALSVLGILLSAVAPRLLDARRRR